MKMSRRAFLKSNAAVAAASAAGIPLGGLATTAVADSSIRWDKAPCRFCGTGCGVLVGVRDGRVVATQGDPDAPVNRGLNCIKGYFLSKIMYGQDRLTKPLLRKKNGKYDKNGEFEPVSWDEAFDVMATKYKEAMKNNGPTSVGMFGSGQWTVWEGYAAAKFMKAGLLSNNLDPNARHCMASAVAGFIRTFGIDEPMGCYDDLEKADAFVLWGSNMAEMHPILWSRLTDRRLTAKHVKVAVLSTFENRNFDLADIGIVFKPQSDLAILNYIANYIIENAAFNDDFLRKHVNFALGNADIGYGLRPEDPREKNAKNAAKAGGSKPIKFAEFKKFVSEYTLDRAHEISGVPKKDLVALAKLYADPKTKVVSYWTMGFNQHTRGTWANNLIYNIHLLTGKISEPGNGPFSLTGQPSACGTAREVGTFAHRLPADMVVMKKEHRDIAEKKWKLPAGAIPAKPGYHAVLQNRMLKDGKLNVYWVMCNNNMQAAANMNHEGLPGYRNPKNFIIVSDPYPTVTAMAADLILPTAMWVEKEGAYGNATAAAPVPAAAAAETATHSAVHRVLGRAAAHRQHQHCQGRDEESCVHRSPPYASGPRGERSKRCATASGAPGSLIAPCCAAGLRNMCVRARRATHSLRSVARLIAVYVSPRVALSPAPAGSRGRSRRRSARARPARRGRRSGPPRPPPPTRCRAG